MCLRSCSSVGWGDNPILGRRQNWSVPKRYTTRSSTHKDNKIWKLLNDKERRQCDDFLDMWGTWRVRNSTVTFLKITRHGYPTHKVDYNYTKHDINKYVQEWDAHTDGFNKIRVFKHLSTDEELRRTPGGTTTTLHDQMERINLLLLRFQTFGKRLTADDCKDDENVCAVSLT